jgi:hypothetical protein
MKHHRIFIIRSTIDTAYYATYYPTFLQTYIPYWSTNKTTLKAAIFPADPET